MGNENTQKHSEQISAFLTFLREVEQENRIAVMTEKEANQETQDIEHALELGDLGYHDHARLSKTFRDIRRKRRRAKDTISVIQPIIDWEIANGREIKAMKRLLGDVRKAENATENRYYTPRTDVVERTLKEKQGGQTTAQNQEIKQIFPSGLPAAPGNN